MPDSRAQHSYVRYSGLASSCLFNHTMIDEIFSTVGLSFILDLPSLMDPNEYRLSTETTECTQIL